MPALEDDADKKASYPTVLYRAHAKTPRWQNGYEARRADDAAEKSRLLKDGWRDHPGAV